MFNPDREGNSTSIMENDVKFRVALICPRCNWPPTTHTDWTVESL